MLRECTDHSNSLFQQHKRKLHTWTSTDGQYKNKIDYILCNQRWRSSLQSTKIRLGADCDSDHEVLIAKFRLKLKKVGKTTRQFRYDLSQIPVLFLHTVWSFSTFGCKEYTQSDFSVDHLMMFMCRVFSCVVGRGCLL